MKKTNKVMASAAVTSALALLMSTTAFAAVPADGGTVVLGNKAYSLDFLAKSDLTSAQIADITSQLSAAGNNLYFKLGASDTSWTNMLDGTTKTDADLAAIAPTVTYVDKNGTASTQHFVDDATLSVSSVSAINLNQIKVTFSKPVDKASATNLANYKLDSTVLGVSPSATKIVLSDDALTATITLDTTHEFGSVPTQGTKKTLTIENVLAKGSFTEKIDKTVKDVTLFDNVTPTVSSVTPTGNTQLTVKLSEAVTCLGGLNSNFKIDGQSITAYGGVATFDPTTKVTDGTDYCDTVVINFSSTLPAGNHTLTIDDVSNNYLQDMAKFTVAKVDQPFTIAQDETAVQVVNVASTTNGDVKVTFNKEISAASVLNAFKVNSSSTLFSGTVNPLNKKEVSFNAGSNIIKEGDNLLYVLNSVQDFYGNEIDAKHSTDWGQMTFKSVKDTVPPSVDGLTVVDDSHVKITFTELVNTVFSQNPSNYKVTDNDGVRQPISSAVAGTNDDGTKTVVTLTFATPLPGTTYTLATSNIQDLVGNTMTKDSRTFVSPDKTAPTAQSAERYTANNDNKMIVKYSEPMDGSAGNIANYYYNDGTGFKAFPASTTVETADNDKTFIFKLPIGYVNVANISTVRTANVKDVSGNVISGATADLSVTNVSADTFTINAIPTDFPKTYMNGSKLVVEFNTSSPIATYVPASFAVKSGDGSTVNVNPDQVLVSGKNVKLQFTTPAKITAIQDQGADLYITGSSSIQDAFGRTLSVAPVTDSDNRIGIDDEIAPQLASSNPVKVIGSNEVSVTFDEAVDANIQGLFANGYTITVNGAPKAILSSTVSSNNTVDFIVNANIKNGDTISVIPTNPSTIKDINGNAYTPVLPDDDITITSNVAPVLNATLGKGSAVGTVKVTASAAVGNTLVYKVGTTPSNIPLVGDPVTGTAYTSGNDITGVDSTVHKYLSIYEVHSGAVVSYVNYSLSSSDITTTCPSITVISVGDALGAANDGKTKVTVPALPSGATGYMYKLSANSTAVSTPVVGDTLTSANGWYALPADGILTQANGNSIGIAAVDASGNAVAFSNVLSIATPNVPAAPAVKTADSAYTTTAKYNTLTTLKVNGVDVALTTVKTLDGSTTALSVNAVKTALNTDLAAAGINNIVATEVGGKVVLTSTGTGAAATIDLTGSDVTSATALGFTTLGAVHGTDSAN